MFGIWSSPVFSQSLTLFYTCLYKWKLMHADPSIRLKPLDRWDHRFESRWAHNCLSLQLVVYCVGSSLYDELITGSEKSYRVFVCVCGRLIVCDLEISKRGDWDPIWVVVPQKKNRRCPRILIRIFFPKRSNQLRGSTNLLFYRHRILFPER